MQVDVKDASTANITKVDVTTIITKQPITVPKHSDCLILTEFVTFTEHWVRVE